MRRKVLHIVFAMVTVMSPMVISVPAAHADNSADLLAMINNLRVGAGRPPLIADPTLTAAAQQWSTHMASTKQLADAPLSTLVPAGWSKLGENVGVGGYVQAIFDALAGNQAHKDIMVDPAFTLTGVAIAAGSDGLLYASEFVEVLRPAVASTTTVAKATTTSVTAATTTTVPTGTTTTAAPSTTVALPVDPSSTTTTTGTALALGPASKKGHGSSPWIFVGVVAAVTLLGLVGAGWATRGGLNPK